MNTNLTDWFDDSIPKEDKVDPMSPRMQALRANEAAPLPQEGQARQRRIEKMEGDLSRLRDFLADCERFAIAMGEIETVQNDVPRLMSSHLTRMRNIAVAKKKELEGELKILKR